MGGSPAKAKQRKVDDDKEEEIVKVEGASAWAIMMQILLTHNKQSKYQD